MSTMNKTAREVARDFAAEATRLEAESRRLAREAKRYRIIARGLRSNGKVKVTS